MHRTLGTILLLALAGGSAHAHFSMVLPQPASAKKGETVTLIYQWGHPFEHQLFDAPPPAQVRVLTPDGKSQSLTKKLEKIKIKSGKGEAAGYRFQFTPDKRGDYTVLLQTPPIWMEDDKEFFQDTVRVVVHVQAQKGWDTELGPAFKMVPLTRPYGLLPGMVFQARVLDREAGTLGAPKYVPLPGVSVYIERYNPQPPKDLPPDELITFETRTDPSGVLTCTLPSTGWWSITAHRLDGKRKYNDKDYPVRQRVTTWVLVGP